MTLAAFDMPPLSGRPLPWGTLASIGLHAGLALALLVVSPIRQLVVPSPPPVAVEIVTPAEFAALQPTPEVTPTLPVGPAPTADTAPAPPGARLAPSAPLQPRLAEHPAIKATQFYSASLLKEPGMELIRQTMKTLADSEKLIQLCNIEGLEQVRRYAPSFDPDTLVPYAMSDPLAAGLTLTAGGGAFRSRRKWYGLSFQCTVAPTLDGVTAFSFTLGDPIPADQWEAHDLTAADEDE